jgi:hypothetical protein
MSGKLSSNPAGLGCLSGRRMHSITPRVRIRGQRLAELAEVPPGEASDLICRVPAPAAGEVGRRKRLSSYLRVRPGDTFAVSLCWAWEKEYNFFGTDQTNVSKPSDFSDVNRRLRARLVQQRFSSSDT